MMKRKEGTQKYPTHNRREEQAERPTKLTLAYLGYPQGAADVSPQLLPVGALAVQLLLKVDAAKVAGLFHRPAGVAGHFAQLARSSSRILNEKQHKTHTHAKDVL